MIKKLFLFIFICLYGCFNGYSLDVATDTVDIRNFKSGLELNNQWKYSEGDNRSASKIDFDDSNWKTIESYPPDSVHQRYKGIIWFRKSYYTDSTLDGLPLAIRIRTNSACDIFIDGKLIHSIGVVGRTEGEQTSGFSILPVTIPIPAVQKGSHLIAIRTSNFGPNINIGLLNVKTTDLPLNFQAEILSMQEALKDKDDIRIFTIPVFFIGVFIVLSIFHFILFLHYRRNRSNLYYSLLTFLLFLLFFGFYSVIAGRDLESVRSMFFLIIFSLMLVPIFFLGILYEVFYKRLLVVFWILAAAFVAALLFLFVFDQEQWGGIFIFIYLFGSFGETIRVYIRAWVKKKEGARIFIIGLFFPVIGLIFFAILNWIFERLGMHEISSTISEYSGEFFAYGMLMSVSLAMTIYLARDFARMNRKLQEQIHEIKQLFDRTVEQENEKKRILENQNEELERMVTFRTEEVVRQKAEIELKNRDILDNLLYARRIQEAILPDIKLIYRVFSDSFIIYKPKDIVSGDFYSFSQRDGKVVISAADCTGHGVTGAFMSMIGSSLLNQIVNERGITTPAEILNNLNAGIAHALKQNENEVNDGMDIALCTIDLSNGRLQYAGANRPLWIFKGGIFTEVKADKLAIGGFRIRKDVTFTNHEMEIAKSDTLYLFSDGFVDQFGELTGKKLLSKNFREFLTSIQNLSMHDQEKKLTDFFTEWKGHVTQIDDVLVIGIRIL